MLFTGKYEYTIDAKHRLAIPAKLRARLDPQRVGTAFYAVRGPNGSAWLWPERTFERMAGSIEARLAPPRPLMAFDHLTFPHADHLEIDTAGRVRLSETLLAECGLEQKVLVLGVRDHIEVWDPDRWRENLRTLEAMRDEIIEQASPMLERRLPPEQQA